MANDSRTLDQNNSQSVRRGYAKPTLRRFGRLEELTRAITGDFDDGDKTGMSKSS